MDWEKLKEQIKSEPRKTLRFVIGLSVTLLSLWVMVFLQAETGTGSEYVEITRLSQTSAASPVSSDSTNAPAVTTTGEEPEKSSSTIVLVLVTTVTGVGCYWFFLRKKIGRHSSDPPKPKKLLTLVEKIDIAPGQSLSVVETSDEYLIVATGSEGITLLKTVKKEKWDSTEKRPESTESQENGFANLLNSMSDGEHPTVNGYYS